MYKRQGLDNSGKSTLLHRLSQGQVTALQPTERPHIDEFQLGGISFKVRRSSPGGSLGLLCGIVLCSGCDSCCLCTSFLASFRGAGGVCRIQPSFMDQQTHLVMASAFLFFSFILRRMGKNIAEAPILARIKYLCVNLARRSCCNSSSRCCYRPRGYVDPS